MKILPMTACLSALALLALNPQTTLAKKKKKKDEPAQTIFYPDSYEDVEGDKDYEEEDAPKPKKPKLTPAQVLAAIPADHWRPIPLSDLMIMTLPRKADGTKREIIVQLMPTVFARTHVANVRKLAKGRYWNGTKIYRVAKGFVTQFGGNPDFKKPPASIKAPPESEYFNPAMLTARKADMAALDAAVAQINADKETAEEDKIKPLKKLIWEPYKVKVGFGLGWPIGSKKQADGSEKAFPISCSGTFSPVHLAAPDTGKGTDIAVVTGKSARNLDGTFGNVGRVIEGLEHLANLPPGPAPLGFYKNKARYIKITSIRMASSLPAARQPKFEYLSSDSPHLLRLIQARDVYGTICDHIVPVRRQSIGQPALAAPAPALPDQPKPPEPSKQPEPSAAAK